jgi:hypothetical protein
MNMNMYMNGNAQNQSWAQLPLSVDKSVVR